MVSPLSSVGTCLRIATVAWFDLLNQYASLLSYLEALHIPRNLTVNRDADLLLYLSSASLPACILIKCLYGCLTSNAPPLKLLLPSFTRELKC